MPDINVQRFEKQPGSLMGLQFPYIVSTVQHELMDKNCKVTQSGTGLCQKPMQSPVFDGHAHEVPDT